MTYAAGQEQLQEAARQAWVGFWHSCMRDAGGSSVLSFDPAPVTEALKAPTPLRENGYDQARYPAVPHKGMSEWARLLEGDERTSGVTLSDVLMGLDDYFKIFRQVKKSHKPAYDYFSRVGVPLCFENNTVNRNALLLDTVKPVVNAADLPSFIGLFMPRSRDTARNVIINDEPAFLDFQLYEKRRRNIAVASPWKWIIYDHSEFALDRDVFTKAERKRFPQCGEWGFHYFIGIDCDGMVAAMPMKMNMPQHLRKKGGTVHHGCFVVPPGIKYLSGSYGVDRYVASQFAAIRAFAASALSGVQLSVRRGGEVARFGIPLAYVRSFFRDREREGARRKPLLHLVGSYQYERGNRSVTVGEHLRGARRFAWRGHDIWITAPGIHHAAPESMVAELLTDEDILPMPDGVITVAKAAQRMQKSIMRVNPVPFRRGMPTQTYRAHNLSVGGAS